MSRSRSRGTVATCSRLMKGSSGNFFHTERTPFSGGSGALPRHPQMARAVLVLGVTTLLGVILVGLYFLQQYGLDLLPVGLAGLLLVVTYTGWINNEDLNHDMGYITLDRRDGDHTGARPGTVVREFSR